MEAIDRALLKALVHQFAFFEEFEDEVLTRDDVARQHAELAEILHELGEADRREPADRISERIRSTAGPRRRRVLEDFLARLDPVG